MLFRNKHRIDRALLYIVLLLGISAPSFAQDRPQTFSAKIGEIVLKGQSYLENEDYDSALSALTGALSYSEATPYERSTIYQMMGAAHYQRQELKLAIRAFEDAISAGGLDAKAVDAMQVNIAQLLIATGQFRLGAERLERYIQSYGDDEAKRYELMAQTWIQAQEYQRALPWAEKWFSIASPKERRHYDLLNFLYYHLKMPKKQATNVKRMIGRWPSEKTLWESLASLKLQAGQDEDAFAVNQLMYENGLLQDEAELLKLVQYYSFYDIPYWGAQILEFEMNTGRISKTAETYTQLSDLYRQAREYKRAIPILERAASLSGTAKQYAQLGEAYYNESNCIEAESAFKQAMNKGYDKGKSWMLIASCRYELAQKADKETCDMSAQERKSSDKNRKRQNAYLAYEQIPETSKYHRDAVKWMSFITAERKAIADKCDYINRIPIELCLIEIDKARDSLILTDGKLELSETCKAHIPHYEAEKGIKLDPKTYG